MKHRLVAPDILFMILLVFLSWIFWDAGITFATDSTPNVVINIPGDGSSGGAMFTGGLWVPGMTQKGTMRICNNHSQRVRVHSLGLTMKLEKDTGEGIEPLSHEEIKGELFESFARNMKLTVKKGRLLVFSDTIFNGSFFDMLYEPGSKTRKGYDLSPLSRFNIDAGDSADLEYTVHMDEKAGNSMQGLKATVAFLVNMDENPVPGGNDEDDDDEDNDDGLIEDPLEKYPDIGGHWAHDCIVTLLKYGIIHGYPDGTIRPDNYITRAEAAVLAANALKLGETTGMLSYIDYIPAWAQEYILSTTKKGVFEGYPGNVFKSENFISREEVAAVLIRAFDKKAKDGTELTFKDREEIGKWAEEYVRAGVDNSIITGYPDNTFKPKDSVTRAEAFTMICKLLGYHSEHLK